jgi:hypothetical protein
MSVNVVCNGKEKENEEMYFMNRNAIKKNNEYPGFNNSF